MANEKIRNAIKESGIKYWELAMRIGISDATLTRWLRKPLTASQEALVLDALSKEGKPNEE